MVEIKTPAEIEAMRGAGREWYAEPGAKVPRPIGDVLQPAVRPPGRSAD